MGCETLKLLLNLRTSEKYLLNLRTSEKHKNYVRQTKKLTPNIAFVKFFGNPAPPLSYQTSVNNGPPFVADCFTIKKQLAEIRFPEKPAK